MAAARGSTGLAVKIIGILYLLAGGLGLMSGVVTVVASRAAQRHQAEAAADPRVAELQMKAEAHRKQLMGSGGILFEHRELFAALTGLVCLAVLVAAVQFLRGRAWARHVLEGATWIVIAYTVWFGVFWVRTVGNFNQTAPRRPDMETHFRAMQWMGLAMMGFWLLLFGAMIYLLRRKEVRRDLT